MIATILMATYLVQAPPVTLSAEVAKVSATKIEGSITVKLPEGWHAYQNPPKSEYENPLKVETKTPKFKLRKVSYPMGELKPSQGGESLVYEGDVKIPFVASLAKGFMAKKGVFSADLIVSYQICSATSCIPPTEAKVKLTWKAPKK
jgi:DsbC/DsbD-like thiol-disulfide interchange protein